MKILLFGKNGQLGWELQRSLAPLGELTALSSDMPGGNFTRLAEVENAIRGLAPDLIVNAAAYTAVDKAESEPELAWQLNAMAPALLAAEAKRNGAWLVHYSTDYVFDGSGNTPWQEADTTNPLNVYGQTKLEGEQAIQQSDCDYLIFRTSWVYGARGGNFAKTMLKLAAERDQLTVINDQFGAPTGADLLADASAHAICGVLQQPSQGGLYHLAAGGETTWHEYAGFVLAFAQRVELTLKVAPQAIQAVPTSNFPTPAQRPMNSRLDTTKLQNTFNLRLPDWKVGVARMLTEILQK